MEGYQERNRLTGHCLVCKKHYFWSAGVGRRVYEKRIRLTGHCLVCKKTLLLICRRVYEERIRLTGQAAREDYSRLTGGKQGEERNRLIGLSGLPGKTASGLLGVCSIYEDIIRLTGHSAREQVVNSLHLQLTAVNNGQPSRTKFSPL